MAVTCGDCRERRVWRRSIRLPQVVETPADDRPVGLETQGVSTTRGYSREAGTQVHPDNLRSPTDDGALCALRGDGSGFNRRDAQWGRRDMRVRLR